MSFFAIPEPRPRVPYTPPEDIPYLSVRSPVTKLLNKRSPRIGDITDAGEFLLPGHPVSIILWGANYVEESRQVTDLAGLEALLASRGVVNNEGPLAIHRSPEGEIKNAGLYAGAISLRRYVFAMPDLSCRGKGRLIITNGWPLFVDLYKLVRNTPSEDDVLARRTQRTSSRHWGL